MKALLLSATVLLAFLALILLWSMDGWIDRQRYVAGTQIKDLQLGLQLYWKDCRELPSTQQGLAALVVNPKTCPGWRGYLTGTSLPLDPWGNAFAYSHPGVNGHDVEIVSAGPDGKFGTTDDVTSWSGGR